MPDNARKRVPTALITGASSGIGEALADCFAAAGHDLVLVARRGAKLRALAADLARRHGIVATVKVADLAQVGAAARLAAALGRRRCVVDVLVNNAGVLAQGRFVGMAPGRQQQIIDLNISGLTAMLSAFLPDMVKRAARGSVGRVLNVASIAAFQPVPTLATYAASKAYVLSLTESLAEELKDSGVTVTCLMPGATDTDFFERADMEDTKVAQGSKDDPADVARVGFDAMMRGDGDVVSGWKNKLQSAIANITPAGVLAEQHRKQAEPGSASKDGK